MGVSASDSPAELESPAKPPVLYLGGMTRTGNHLILGLLDGHSRLAVPPDEDYTFLTLFSRRGLPERLRQWWYRNGVRRVPPESLWRVNKDNALKRYCGRAAEQAGDRFSDAYSRCEARLNALNASPPRSLYRFFDGYLDAMIAWSGEPAAPPKYRVYFCAGADSVGRFILANGVGNRAVIVIRDPLQQTASWMVRQAGEPKSERLLLERCAYWNRVFDGYEEMAKDRRVAFVAYEDLVNSPEATLSGLLKHLDLELEPINLEPTVGGVPRKSNSSFKSEQGIDKGALESYRKVFDEADIAILEERMCGRYGKFKQRYVK
jgi:hypothetical protein